jgi:DNA-binding transcriptional ArsR family regulator
MQQRKPRPEAKKSKAASVTRLPRAADIEKLEGNAAHACELLKAMANPARLMVLCQIAHGEKSVGELERTVGLSQSGLSQHLAVLRNKHIVSTRRDAQTIYYSLASEEAAAVMATLYQVFCNAAARRTASKPRSKAA